MENQEYEHVYTVEDLNKAYDMGLESAVCILEKSIGLSVAGQQYMLSRLKKEIMEGRIQSFLKSK